jgi:hypothetical protein
MCGVIGLCEKGVMRFASNGSLCLQAVQGHSIPSYLLGFLQCAGLVWAVGGGRLTGVFRRRSFIWPVAV